MSAKNNALRSERPVVVLLLRRRVRFAVHLWRLRVQHVDRVLVQCVDVLLVRRHFRLDGARLARRDRAQWLRNGVVTFRSPRDIVHIGELHEREDDQVKQGDSRWRRRTA